MHNFFACSFVTIVIYLNVLSLWTCRSCVVSLLVHSPSQKSPIPSADHRFEEGLDAHSIARPTKKSGYQVRGKAKALYKFTAQNPR